MDPSAAARLPTRHRYAEAEVIALSWLPTGSPPDPRHVFLHAREVMSRYGWGKTKGYQNLKDRELVPAPVMTHPDLWRLDQLLAWEERRMAKAQVETFLAPDREPLSVTDLLPQPKRRPRSA